MAKTDEIIERSILQSLLAASDGLEVAEIIEQVSSVHGAPSSRALRNFLGRLEKEQKIVRRKRWTKGPGAPRYVYYHSEFGPQQIKLFDDTFGVRGHTVETKPD